MTPSSYGSAGLFVCQRGDSESRRTVTTISVEGGDVRIATNDYAFVMIRIATRIRELLTEIFTVTRLGAIIVRSLRNRLFRRRLAVSECICVKVQTLLSPVRAPGL